MRPACTVVVFAKAPVAGFAKTRLIPALGAAGAAALAQRLLLHALQQAVAAQVGPVELCVAPDTPDPVCAALGRAMGLALTPQGPGDLGARMGRAFERVLNRCDAALLIGTDAPALDALTLRQAAAALREHDAVFVPALDGGYALVGLRRLVPALFDNMTWSEPSVMARTRERAVAAGLSLVELAPVADIDRPADLVHVPPHWAATGGTGAFATTQDTSTQ
jgi:rSAM/selenodomain-associated transferase 1